MRENGRYASCMGRSEDNPTSPASFSQLSVVVKSLHTLYLSTLIAHTFSFLYTRLQTPNFWPSLSKVTGNHLTERYIWRLCISIAAPLRLAEEALCYQFFSQRHQKVWYKLLNMAKLICGISEVGCLITYSFVSGKEDFGELISKH